MPRPIAFDHAQVLDHAVQLFWRLGYHQTSVRDLTEATRLKPGSLYGAFHNKRSLFLCALDHYSAALRAGVDHVLRNDRPPLERIRTFFRHLLQESADDPQQKGCLLVNTLLETPADDVEVTQRAAAALRYVERTFAEVLEEAKREGTVAPGLDSAAQARLLMTGIFGMRVYAKMGTPETTLPGIVDTLLAGLVR